METINILTRHGGFVHMAWSYDPAINKKATERARKKLKCMGKANAELVEVAPEVFWYKLSNRLACDTY